MAGYDDRLVLDGVGLRVNPGDVLGLIGHNGSGKSTLLRALVGLVAARSGTVMVRGSVIPTPAPATLLELGVRMVPQGGGVFPTLTVAENVSLAMPRRGSPRRTPTEALIELGFEQVAALARRPASLLSGGERALAAFACACVSQPDVLLLDEPFLGVAERGTRQLAQLIATQAARGVGLVVVEHRIRLILELCNRVCVLRNGRVSYDGAAAPLNDEALLWSVYA